MNESHEQHDNPGVTTHENTRARAIFLELGTLSGPALEAELSRLTGGDDALRRAVVHLLAAHHAADAAGFMTGPTAELPMVRLTETAGTRIGPYKLLQTIGEGGFGTVFLAEQSEPVRRKVALKVIKLGMDSRQVIARFEAERQALAVMNHPHIARVFDGGVTDSGRPYFVMEYVVGDAITPFCDAHKLSVPDRLNLFQQVCAAVQHAHTKGIIHRDLKPANILVSMVDGKPFAKVIDFGIAKATAAPLTDKTLFTEHRQLIGTPEYMSPEQAEGSPDIDTRTDVYALGVLLYELLTGLTPFDAKRLRSAAYAEMQRIIKEEEPPAPSLRIARALETQTQTAQARQVEPGRLSTLVKGELDWIVMKALDKDRARRYESAVQLAADVGNHLAGEAVVAAPPSAAYRVKKFVRRHKGPVIAGSAVAAALVVGIIGTTWQWVRADRASEVAEASEREAREAQRAEGEQRRIAVEEAERAERAATMEREAREEAQRRSVVAEDRGRFALAQHLSEDDPVASALVLRELGPDQRSVSEAQMYDLARRSAPWVQVLGGHEGGLYGAAWSPDGTRIVTASSDKAARIWNADGSGEPIILRGHEELISHAAWSPDGTRIVTASRDKTARIWNADGTGEPIVLSGHDRAVYHAEWSPDGNRVVTALWDTTARIWNADGTGLPIVLHGHDAWIRDVAWSPDGARIVTASDDKTARIWNADGSGEPIVLHGHKDAVYQAVWSPDGTRIFTSSGDLVHIWQTDGIGGSTVLAGHENGVISVEWSPDGTRVATGSYDGTARIWNADGSGEPIVLSGHKGGVLSAAWSADGMRILTAAEDRTVRMWNADGSGEPVVHSRHPRWVRAADWSPDGQRVLTQDIEGIVLVWQADTGGEPLVFRLTEDQEFASWSPDGTRFVATSRGGTLEVWNTDGSGAPIVLRGHEDLVPQAEWSPDGVRIVSASHDGTARVWNADGSGEPIILRGHQERISHAEWSPDGNRVVTASWDKTARIWNADGSGVPIVLHGHDAWIRDVAWSPDGARIATTSDDRTARIWNADGIGEPVILRVQAGPIRHVAWSSDGTRVVMALNDEPAQVWRADGKEAPVLLRAPRISIGHVAWSPDGTRIVTSSYIMAQIWQADGTGDPIVLGEGLGEFEYAAWSPDGTRILTALSDTSFDATIWPVDGQSFETIVLRGHEGTVDRAQWSSDGTRILTASYDKTVRIWTPNWPFQRRRIWEAGGMLSVDDRIRLLGEDRPVAEAHFAQDEAYYAELRAARRDGRPLPEPPVRERAGP